MRKELLMRGDLRPALAVVLLGLVLLGGCRWVGGSGSWGTPPQPEEPSPTLHQQMLADCFEQHFSRLPPHRQFYLYLDAQGNAVPVGTTQVGRFRVEVIEAEKLKQQFANRGQTPPLHGVQWFVVPPTAETEAQQIQVSIATNGGQPAVYRYELRGDSFRRLSQGG